MLIGAVSCGLSDINPYTFLNNDLKVAGNSDFLSAVLFIHEGREKRMPAKPAFKRLFAEIQDKA